MTFHSRQWLFWLPSVLCLCVLVGCGAQGPPTVPVTGTVIFDDSPVADAAVMFTGPDAGQRVTAMTDASGKFSLEAVPGTNQVAVEKSKTIGDAGTAPTGGEDAGMPEDDEMGAEPEVEWIIPFKYSNYRTSELTVEVSKGMDPVTLELTSKAAKE